MRNGSSAPRRGCPTRFASGFEEPGSQRLPEPAFAFGDIRNGLCLPGYAAGAALIRKGHQVAGVPCWFAGNCLRDCQGHTARSASDARWQVGLECSGLVAALNPLQIRVPIFGAKPFDVQRFALNKLQDTRGDVKPLGEKSLMKLVSGLRRRATHVNGTESSARRLSFN